MSAKRSGVVLHSSTRPRASTQHVREHAVRLLLASVVVLELTENCALDVPRKRKRVGLAYATLTFYELLISWTLYKLDPQRIQDS